jgi:hypothetical protein
VGRALALFVEGFLKAYGMKIRHNRVGVVALGSSTVLRLLNGLNPSSRQLPSR